VYKKLNSATELIHRHQGGSPVQSMHYVGLDVHKKGNVTLELRFCFKCEQPADDFTLATFYQAVNADHDR
jgi:hypothetical protein